MNTRATLLVMTMVLAGCSSSHDDRSTLATPQPTTALSPAGAMHGAVKTPGTLFAPIAAALKAAKASPGAVVTPQSGASEAARAAEVESRSSTIPIVRDVPASGVMAAPRSSIPAKVVPISAAELPPGVPYASDKDPVQIVSYVLSSTIIHPGDKVTGDVVTSSNAASVTAQVGAFSVAVPKIAPGKFHLLMQLPSMPLPPGAEKLIITAIRTDGMRTTREVPITVVL